VFSKYAPFILGFIEKFTILQYRQCITGGGFATKSRRSYCPRKADGFAAAFSGTANNGVVCNRGQYIIKMMCVFFWLPISMECVLEFAKGFFPI